MRWFWLVLHLATAEHVISSHQNGEEICENKGFNASECAAVGCCHYDDGQCRSTVGPGPCSRRVLQSYGPASVAGTIVASTGMEPSSGEKLLLYMLVISYYPFIVAVAGMLVGCLAAFAGCGLARLGRGDANGARLTALRWAFDGVVVCAALRGVWVAATVINIQRHNDSWGGAWFQAWFACIIGSDSCGMITWAPVIFFGLAGCVARVIVAAKLRTARQAGRQGQWRYSLCDCFSRPMSCLSVFCCSPCTLGQASSISFGGNATPCFIVAVVLFVLTLTSYVLRFAICYAISNNSGMMGDLCVAHNIMDANTISNNLSAVLYLISNMRPTAWTTSDGVVVAAAVLYLIASIVACAVVFAARRAIRTRERIEGSAAADCCVAICCASCSVCQILNNVPGNYLGFWSTYDTLSQPAPLPEGDDTTQERVTIKIIKSKKPFLQQAKTEVELLPTGAYVDSAELELGESSAA